MVRDIDAKLLALHGKAARRCHALAVELLKTVYVALPRSQAAAEAVFLLYNAACEDQHWEQCVHWCNVLLKDYPQAEIPEVVGKRHQFCTYRARGEAQAKLGQSSAAAESLAQSLLSANAPVYHIVGWKCLLEHDARLASSDVMAKVTPRMQKEFARRAEAAGLRVQLSRVPLSSLPPAVTPGSVGSLPDDNNWIAVCMTVEYPGGDKLRGAAIPDFRVSVHACPAKPDLKDFSQFSALIPPAPVWSSDIMTLAAGQSISKRFMVPRKILYSDRPVALLAELSAEKPTTYNNLPVNSWPLAYWSQPMLLNYRPADGVQPPDVPREAHPELRFSVAITAAVYWSQLLPFDDRPAAGTQPDAMSFAKPTLNFDFLWRSRPESYWSQPLPFGDAAIALAMADQPAAEAQPAKGPLSKPLSLADATARLAEKWKPVACVGIPKETQGFSIARYDEGKRVDLMSDSNVYVSYEEFAVNPAGRVQHPGSSCGSMARQIRSSGGNQSWTWTAATTWISLVSPATACSPSTHSKRPALLRMKSRSHSGLPGWRPGA